LRTQAPAMEERPRRCQTPFCVFLIRYETCHRTSSNKSRATGRQTPADVASVALWVLGGGAAAIFREFCLELLRAWHSRFVSRAQNTDTSREPHSSSEAWSGAWDSNLKPLRVLANQSAKPLRPMLTGIFVRVATEETAFAISSNGTPHPSCGIASADT